MRAKPPAFGRTWRKGGHSADIYLRKSGRYLCKTKKSSIFNGFLVPTVRVELTTY